MQALYKKCAETNIHNHFPLAPKLRDDIHQVFPFFGNLSEPEFRRSLATNFPVSKSMSPQFYKK